MPSSFGSWPAATVSPTPTLMPTSVASEMLSISAPSRSSRATSRIAPTSSVSVARRASRVVAAGRDAGREQRRRREVATVEVVLTDSVRDPPSSAYTTIGTMHV